MPSSVHCAGSKIVAQLNQLLSVASLFFGKNSCWEALEKLLRMEYSSKNAGNISLSAHVQAYLDLLFFSASQIWTTGSREVIVAAVGSAGAETEGSSFSAGTLAWNSLSFSKPSRGVFNFIFVPHCIVLVYWYLQTCVNWAHILVSYGVTHGHLVSSIGKYERTLATRLMTVNMFPSFYELWWNATFSNFANVRHSVGKGALVKLCWFSQSSGRAHVISNLWGMNREQECAFIFHSVARLPSFPRWVLSIIVRAGLKQLYFNTNDLIQL